MDAVEVQERDAAGTSLFAARAGVAAMTAAWLDADAVGRMLPYLPTKNTAATVIPTSTAHARSNAFGERALISLSRSSALTGAAPVHA